MTSDLSLDPSRTALLLMDFQNDLISPGGAIAPTDQEIQQRISNILATSASAAEAARRVGLPVIHIAVGRRPDIPSPYPHMPLFQYMVKENALLEGTPGFEFHPQVQPGPGELVFVKRGISALAGTELGPYLRGRGIDTLVLCGYVTHMVVVGTAREAADYGYRVLVLEDCCTSGDMTRHQAAIENMRMISIVTDSAEFKKSVG